jgi:hypothetical protein
LIPEVIPSNKKGNYHCSGGQESEKIDGLIKAVDTKFVASSKILTVEQQSKFAGIVSQKWGLKQLVTKRSDFNVSN